MAHERLDPAFVPVLDAAGGALTLAQLRERCDDAWAQPLAEDWAREALDRGLVAARSQADLPLQWTLTGKGRKLARRLRAG
jgi:hypothetical protein